jgi:hypothetical protein
MDEQEQQRARAWFDQWVRDKPCPVCNSTNWYLGDALAQWPYLTPLQAGISLGTGRYPVVVCLCQTCGYILPASAIIAGVRQPPFN